MNHNKKYYLHRAAKSQKSIENQNTPFEKHTLRPKRCVVIFFRMEHSNSELKHNLSPIWSYELLEAEWNCEAIFRTQLLFTFCKDCIHIILPRFWRILNMRNKSQKTRLSPQDTKTRHKRKLGSLTKVSHYRMISRGKTTQCKEMAKVKTIIKRRGRTNRSTANNMF